MYLQSRSSWARSRPSTFCLACTFTPRTSGGARRRLPAEGPALHPVSADAEHLEAQHDTLPERSPRLGERAGRSVGSPFLSR